MPQLNHFTYGFYDEFEKIAGHPLALLLRQIAMGAAMEAGSGAVAHLSRPREHAHEYRRAYPGE